MMNTTDNNSMFNFTEATSSNTQKNISWVIEFQTDLAMASRNKFIIFCYSVIVLVSIFGNVLVCSIVIRNRNMRSATYVFITNLALSDLMMTVLNIPFNVARLLLNDWPFGSFMCSFAPLMQVTSVYVSTFTMMCIAVDRYRHVSQPFTPRLEPFKAIEVMICVWIFSLLLSIPHAVFNKIGSVFTYRKLIRCRTIYPAKARRWITLTTVSTQYIIPLTVTGILYCLIMARVWSRNVLGVVTEAQIISRAKSKRRTIKMLILVVMFFAVCWMPLNLFHLLHEFNVTRFIYKSSMPSTVFFACHWLAMSSVCYNPFIYCWLNEKFWSGAKGCIHCLANMVWKIESSLRSSRDGDITRTNVSSTTCRAECFSTPWGKSKRSSRMAMIPLKDFSPNPFVESSRFALVKVKFHSVPDLSKVEWNGIRNGRLEDRDWKFVEFNANGKAVDGLRRCYSLDYI